MAVLRRTTYTTACDIAVATMGMVINDDDPEDVMIHYGDESVRFARWSGARSVTVTPNKVSCGESFDCTFKVYKGRMAYEHTLNFRITNMYEMCYEIYKFIQANDMKLPDGTSL